MIPFVRLNNSLTNTFKFISLTKIDPNNIFYGSANGTNERSVYSYDPTTENRTPKTWLNGPTGQSYGVNENVFTDGTNIYWHASNSDYIYKLDKTTYDWGNPIATLSTSPSYFSVKDLWTDGVNVYLDIFLSHYVWNSTNYTWSTMTWTGSLTSPNAMYIWTDGVNIYSSSGTDHHILDVGTHTWSTMTWNGLTDFTSNDLWTDGENIYYSKYNNHYVLDIESHTWRPKTWYGTGWATHDHNASDIWTDGKGIYYQNSMVLDKSTSTWSTKTWIGNFTPDYNYYSSYSGRFWSYSVPKVLTSMSVEELPEKTDYFVGDSSLDTTGLKLKLLYDDGITRTISSGYTTSNPDFTTVPTGDYRTETVTVYYTDENNVSVTTTFDIKVYKIMLDSISIETLPNKTVYSLNETFSLTGLTVRKTYNNSSYTIISSGYYSTTPDMTTEGVKTVTITVQEDGITKQTSFDIVVGDGSIIEYYDGSEFVQAEVNYCESVSGGVANFVKCKVYRYNGTDWEFING